MLLLGVPNVSRKKDVMCQFKVAPSKKTFEHTLQLAQKKDGYNGWPIKNCHLGLLALLESHGK
jgi:hypothetical protein